VPVLYVKLTNDEMEELKQARIDLEHKERRRLSWRDFVLLLARRRSRGL
jgi:hypothetical protein